MLEGCDSVVCIEGIDRGVILVYDLLKSQGIAQLKSKKTRLRTTAFRVFYRRVAKDASRDGVVMAMKG